MTLKTPHLLFYFPTVWFVLTTNYLKKNSKDPHLFKPVLHTSEYSFKKPSWQKSRLCQRSQTVNIFQVQSIIERETDRHTERKRERACIHCGLHGHMASVPQEKLIMKWDHDRLTARFVQPWAEPLSGQRQMPFKRTSLSFTNKMREGDVLTSVRKRNRYNLGAFATHGLRARLKRSCTLKEQKCIYLVVRSTIWLLHLYHYNRNE